jgi:hypothetical protein
MGYSGLRKDFENKYVAQNVQTCTMCGRNFSSDRAGNRHYKRYKPWGERCQEPTSVGLVPFQNKHGATIWREKVRNELKQL